MDDEHPHATNPHTQTKAVLNRLSRIEGHVRAIKEMVREGRDCPDVLIQLAAVRSALDQAARVVLADHMENCVRGAAHNGHWEEEWSALRKALDCFLR